MPELQNFVESNQLIIESFRYAVSVTAPILIGSTLHRAVEKLDETNDTIPNLFLSSREAMTSALLSGIAGAGLALEYIASNMPIKTFHISFLFGGIVIGYVIRGIQSILPDDINSNRQ